MLSWIRLTAVIWLTVLKVQYSAEFKVASQCSAHEWAVCFSHSMEKGICSLRLFVAQMTANMSNSNIVFTSICNFSLFSICDPEKNQSYLSGVKCMINRQWHSSTKLLIHLKHHRKWTGDNIKDLTSTSHKYNPVLLFMHGLSTFLIQVLLVLFSSSYRNTPIYIHCKSTWFSNPPLRQYVKEFHNWVFFLVKWATHLQDLRLTGLESCLCLPSFITYCILMTLPGNTWNE